MQIVLGSSQRWSRQREEADFHHGRSCESTHGVPLEVQVESNSSSGGRHEADAKEKIKRFVVIHEDGSVEGVFKDVEQFTFHKWGNSLASRLYRLWNRAMDALFHRRKWASYGSMGMGIGPQSRPKLCQISDRLNPEQTEANRISCFSWVTKLQLVGTVAFSYKFWTHGFGRWDGLQTETRSLSNPY